jgi:hypothetical protein
MIPFSQHCAPSFSDFRDALDQFLACYADGDYAEWRCTTDQWKKRSSGKANHAALYAWNDPVFSQGLTPVQMNIPGKRSFWACLHWEKSQLLLREQEPGRVPAKTHVIILIPPEWLAAFKSLSWPEPLDAYVNS